MVKAWGAVGSTGSTGLEEQHELQEQLEQPEVLEQEGTEEQVDSVEAAPGKRAKGTWVRAATAGGISFIGMGEASRWVFGQKQQGKSC